MLSESVMLKKNVLQFKLIIYENRIKCLTEAVKKRSLVVLKALCYLPYLNSEFHVSLLSL